MEDQLYKIRHSAAHMLAAAVLQKWPDAKLAIGPVIDTGFYYDFDLEHRLTEEDLVELEELTRKLINQGISFAKRTETIDQALGHVAGQPYKEELIRDLAASGETEVSFYTSGPLDDLCRGPHVANTKEIGVVKLLSVAGAYWRGDEKKKMLQRIYGTAFATKKELDAYLNMLAEAKKRDHRVLGRELDLFTFSDLVGSGLPLFTPKGTMLREAIVSKIRQIEAPYGYQYVTIPHITKKELYMTSGHWDKYKDSLFHVKGVDSEFVMKPMNCPHHTQIYASAQRSYRDLPQRFAEVTMVYRDEQGGELLGISRVRSITQDDAHLFVRPDQIKEEVGNIVKIIKEFYASLGMFEEGMYRASLSVRDSQTPEKYLGEEANWNLAEQVLQEIAEAEHVPCQRMEGEAAFYGPKLDFMFKDAIGREWQLATVQIDFVMPARFGLTYIDRDSSKQTPVMIHRAIAGSLERFLSVIIEHFAGAFPLWLAPVQATVVPVSEKFLDYANAVVTQLRQSGLRVELDAADETLGKRIRLAEKAKVPYILVVGEKEAQDGTVTIRQRGVADQKVVAITEFVTTAQSELKA